MSAYLTYARQLPWHTPFGLPTIGCTIREDGECTAFSSWGDDARPEIGTYAMRTDPAWVEQMWASVRSSGHATMSVPPLPPDVPLVALGEGMGDDPPAGLQAFEADAIPEPVRPLVVLLDSVVESLREHRSTVLRGEAAWRTPGVRPGEPLSLDVSLTNTGVSTAAFHQVAVANPDAIATLTLHRKVDDQPSDEERDAATVVLASTEFCAVSGPAADAGPVMVLEPDQSATWLLRRAAYLEPGRYQAWLSLHVRAGNLEPELAVTGSLRLDVGTLHVLP